MKYLDTLIRMLSICKYGLVIGYVYAAFVLIYQDYVITTLFLVSFAYLFVVAIFAFFERQLRKRYDSICAKLNS